MRKQIKIDAEIRYDMKSNHPDLKYVTRDFGHKYRDVYTIYPDAFYSEDEMYAYIKHDLMLVAGGGYSTNTITNVRFFISEVA